MELPKAIAYAVVNSPHGRNIWYDKQTGELSNATVINDFMGNAPVSLGNFRDGYFVQIWEPGLLLDRIDDRWLPNNKMTDAQKHDLEKFRDSIDPEGNNIMLIGKLKQ